MNREIEELIDYIAKNFEFNSEKYPELRNVSKKERLRFAIRHSSLHFAKTAGKIAASSEGTDHGDTLDIQNLKVNTAKSLINTLRLAELLGMSGVELIRLVKESIESPVNKPKAG
jgi:hypothetical protein